MLPVVCGYQKSIKVVVSTSARILYWPIRVHLMHGVTEMTAQETIVPKPPWRGASNGVIEVPREHIMFICRNLWRCPISFGGLETVVIQSFPSTTLKWLNTPWGHIPLGSHSRDSTLARPIP